MIFLLFQVSVSAALIVDTPAQRVILIGHENRTEKVENENRITLIKHESRINEISG